MSVSKTGIGDAWLDRALRMAAAAVIDATRPPAADDYVLAGPADG